MVLTDESLNRPTLDWADVPNNENLLGQRHYRRCRTTVYNIEVEDYHTYCVDYQCILAHNQNLCRPAMHAVSELIADDGVAGNASKPSKAAAKLQSALPSITNLAPTACPTCPKTSAKPKPNTGKNAPKKYRQNRCRK